MHRNDQQIGQVVDSTFGEGLLGMAASAYAADYIAKYDNFLLVFMPASL